MRGVSRGGCFQRVYLISFGSCHPVTVSQKTVAMLSYPWPFLKCGKRDVREGKWSWTMAGAGGRGDYNQDSSREAYTGQLYNLLFRLRHFGE